MTEPRSVLVRAWLPDRPGALGLVASRIGAVRGDIVGIDVLEQGDGVVIDEFAVRLPDLSLVRVLVREIEEVDGVSVEEVREVARFPDPRLDALGTTAELCAEIMAESRRNPAVARIYQDMEADVRERFIALLRSAADRGEVRRDIDYDGTVTVLFALADGLSWRRAVEPTFNAESVVPIVLGMVEKLLASPGDDGAGQPGSGGK